MKIIQTLKNLFMRNSSNFKITIIALLVILAVWFYKDWQFNKEGNLRHTENVSQLLLKDKALSTYILLNEKELSDHISKNKELSTLLKKLEIKKDRVETVTYYQTKYIDTVKRKTIVPNVMEKGLSFTYPVIDSSACHLIKGEIQFENNELSFVINKREFHNKNTVVGYWQRREWKFLGIRTRFLGKIESQVKSEDQCGSIQTVIIKKK